MSYIFLLGRKDEISLAELKARLSGVSRLSDKTAIFEGKLPLEPQKFLNSLGGSIKICEVIDEVRNLENCPEFINEYLLEKYADHETKINFGVSVYNLAGKDEIFLKSTLKSIKNFLKENGKKVRFVNKMFKNVANTAIHDNGLLRHGVEICVFGGLNESGEEIYHIAKTVAVQDFKMYGFRDFERPARDQRSGMLPPKLAQVMINLSGVKAGKVLWDPFCGSGTVLMEGLLMGINAIGSDISEKAIQDSTQNLEWLNHHFKIKEQWKVFVQDATKPEKTPKADVIIAETYLGPPLFKAPGPGKSQEILEEASDIIFGFLEENTLKCTIVLAVPFIRGQRESFYIENFIEKAEKLGYIVPVLDKQYKSLLYDRPEQVVGREIFKLKSRH